MAGQRPQGTGARFRGADTALASADTADTADGHGSADGHERRARRAARTGLALWVGALVVGTWLFHAIGNGPLAAPPLDPSAWVLWAEGRDPLVATFAVLRLLVLGLSWYLVGATSIGILARLLRAASLVRIADAITVPALRRVLQGALGISLATAMVTSSVSPSGLQARDGSTITLQIAGDDAVAPVTSAANITLAALGDDERITLEHIQGEDRPLPLELLDRARERDAAAEAAADGDATDAPEVTVGPGSDHDDAHPDAADPDGAAREPGLAGRSASAVAGEHLVVAGESFWTIAEHSMSERLDRRPTEAETAAHWERLVDANRDRLVDHDNPDLIFPGQVLTVPPPGSVGSVAVSGR